MRKTILVLLCLLVPALGQAQTRIAGVTAAKIGRSMAAGAAPFVDCYVNAATDKNLTLQTQGYSLITINISGGTATGGTFAFKSWAGNAAPFYPLLMTNAETGVQVTSTTTSGTFTATTANPYVCVDNTATGGGSFNVMITATIGGMLFPSAGVPGPWSASPFLAGDGTCAAPAFTFTSESSLGYYRVAAGKVGACSGTVAVFDWNASRMNVALPLTGASVTDSSSSTTGAWTTAGGLGVAKKLYVGTGITLNNTANPVIAIVDNGGASAGLTLQSTTTSWGLYANAGSNFFGVYDGTAGAYRMTIANSTGNVGFAAQIVPKLGAVGSPAIAPIGDLTTGFYFGGDTSVKLASNGVARLTIATNFRIAADMGVIWSDSSTDPAGGDTQIIRTGPQVLRLANNAASAGVRLDFNTGDTLKLRANDASDTAVSDVRTYSTSGDAGCTGTPTTSTRGINTACVEPGSTVVLSRAEYDDFLAMREWFRSHVGGNTDGKGTQSNSSTKVDSDQRRPEVRVVR